MIEAFTGLPGAGKTYNMVRKAYQHYLYGKTIYANFECSFATRFTELDEIYEVKNAIILIDEAGIYLPAQSWKSIPFEFLRAIRQHRKNGLDLYYTGQDMRDVATALRRVTQFQHDFERVWKVFICHTTSPTRKKKYGFNVTLLKKKIFKLYDTNFEVGFSKYMKNELKKTS